MLRNLHNFHRYAQPIIQIPLNRSNVKIRKNSQFFTYYVFLMSSLSTVNQRMTMRVSSVVAKLNRRQVVIESNPR